MTFNISRAQHNTFLFIKRLASVPAIMVLVGAFMASNALAAHSPS